MTCFHAKGQNLNDIILHSAWPNYIYSPFSYSMQKDRHEFDEFEESFKVVNLKTCLPVARPSKVCNMYHHYMPV